MADTDMTLLRMAARVDPHLRDAVARVDDELRALRESRDALVEALREIASGTSGPLGRDGSSFDELFAYVTSVARAALAKAEALGAVGAQG